MGTLQYGRNRLTIVATQTVRQELNLHCVTQVMTQTASGIVFRPSLYIDDLYISTNPDDYCQK